MNLPTRITAALRNPILQAALDRNAERRRQGRDRAFAELSAAEAVRDRARAVRLETLAHLDRYLEQFVDNFERHGGRAHWAPDAAAARGIVLDIVQAAMRQYPRQHDRAAVPLVAKSKSMLSEEIGLNAALEAAGWRVVETDLGEFIVQLRGERPAHIITPAVHLRREEVAALFGQHFGMAPSRDVKDMTAVARAQLRRVFFDAVVGISGVNLAVAESGSLILLTNEGNGRLVTTVPPVHIALLGIERLTPTLADGEILLRVLPRSASAQKVTSYISLLQGPRRPGEPIGVQERHVVLIDNGRSRLLGSERAEALLCLRCGACLNACPVFREIGGHAYGAVYPGPIGLAIAPDLCGYEFCELAGLSTLCGACREVCPVRIDLPRLALQLRGIALYRQQQPGWLRWGMWMYAQVMASSGRYVLAQRMAAWVTAGLARVNRLRSLPPPLNAWTARRDFPRLATETFRKRWKRRNAGGRRA